MKRKNIKRITAVALTAVMTVGMAAMRLPSGILEVHAADEIAINTSNFDARICTYLSENYDSDNDGYIDDVSKVINISISDSATPVESLAGLEKLTNLQFLKIEHGAFTSADLTGCTKLFDIELRYCSNIETLDVSGLTDITSMYILFAEKLTTVTGIENMPKLQMLGIGSTAMEYLDLRNNTELIDIYAAENKLHTLLVSGLSKLVELQCYNNVLQELDLTGCTAVERLRCGHNSWSSGSPLDLTKIPNVKYLNIHNYVMSEDDRPITSITFPEGNQLEELRVGGNSITSLDVSSCKKLINLYCDNNPIEELILDCPELDYLCFQQIKEDTTKAFELDTSKCPKLTNITLLYNRMIKSVDFSSNTMLEEINLSFTKITDLDVTNNVKLWNLDVMDTDLTSLNLSNNTELLYLDIRGTDIESIELSNNTKLRSLNISESPLKTLSLKNLSNLEKFKANYSYSEDDNNVLESIDFTGCTALKQVELEDIENLYSVDLTDCTALEELELTKAVVLMCKLPETNTTVEIIEENNGVYLDNVKETFDLKSLAPDIDGTKISDVTGSNEDSTVEANGTVLSGYKKGEAVSYKYDCGNGMSINPVLMIYSFEQSPNSWITPLTMEGWTYSADNSTANEPNAVAEYGTVKYTYSTSENGAYTSTKPSTVGTYWVKATVAETDTYEGLESEAVQFVIAKANPTYTVPASLKALVGQTLAQITLTDGFAWINDTLSVGSKGTNTFKATFTPSDIVNYNIINNIDVEVEVSLNPNEWTDELTIEGWTYGEEANKPKAEAKYGTVEYAYSNAADGTFTTDVPTNAGIWYVRAAVAETDVYEGLVSAAVAFEIRKATPEYTLPENICAFVGQTLTDVELTGGFSWMDESQAVGDARLTSFKARYTPADTDNYNVVENIDILVLVKLYANEWTDELTIEGWTYGEEANKPKAEAKYGTVEYAYSNAADGIFTADVPTNAGTYYVKATVAEGATYMGIESRTVAFEIKKATPEYTMPAGLTGNAGEKLETIELPKGFSWMNANEVLGAASQARAVSVSNIYLAKFTPNDTVNYNIVENIELVVEVVLNENEWTDELAIEGWTYGEEANKPKAEAKYGTVEYAYSNAADGIFTADVPTNAGTYYVKAAVTQGNTYTGIETAAVAFEIKKATPKYTVPSDLTAKEGQTLEEVKLPDGFGWTDAKQSVGNAGNNRFKATFTPKDAANYTSVELELSVNVKAAEVEQDAIYTGDTTAVELWIIILAVSMIAFVMASKRKTA